VALALWLLAVQGVFGAFDTLYYHEWRARLPSRPEAALELRIHAARDALYAVLFVTLPWIAWRGAWTLVLALVLLAEIGLTLADFAIERKVRRSMGDVFAGERVTHALMGILYGAMLANLIPALRDAASLPTELAWSPAPVPVFLRYALVLMGVGVLLSGVRDLAAAAGLKGAAWPWSRRPAASDP
jgi:hypothetical protein